VVEVYADGVAHSEEFARHGDVDAAGALLRFEEGAIGLLTGSRHDPLGYDCRVELFGSGDSITVGLGERTPLDRLDGDTAENRTGRWSNFLDRFGDAYAAEMDAFLRAALEGGESPCSGADSRRALQVALAAERSKAEHRPVLVDEVA
jgi:myo-inositol 2-dehydrogenase/D-chiro-inositol 1-dehydrogenase